MCHLILWGILEDYHGTGWAIGCSTTIIKMNRTQIKNEETVKKTMSSFLFWKPLSKISIELRVVASQLIVFFMNTSDTYAICIYIERTIGRYL